MTNEMWAVVRATEDAGEILAVLPDRGVALGAADELGEGIAPNPCGFSPRASPVASCTPGCAGRSWSTAP
ncbi:hypothetical protein GCM10029964_092170 [Kibdelosporangium lantanae]